MKNRAATVIAAAAVVGLLGAGAGYSANELTGKDIKNGSLTGKDIKNESIGLGELRPGTVAKLTAPGSGPAGPAGPAGPQGVPGAKGDPGAAGQSIVANVTTSASTPGANAQTGLVPVPVEEASVFTSARGVALVSTSLPAGRYVVSGTAVFYAFGASTGQYGEARVFIADGTPQGSSIFSGEVPPAALGGVAAQTGASVEVNLAAATTLTLRARLRGGAAGASTVQGGANLLITKVG